MKSLKKIALVSAIAAAPFAAQADMLALDDAAMGTVTGQAGVTIELQTKVSIGEFLYTDEGQFSVKGITIGGGAVERDASGAVTGVSGLLDDIKVDIDVLADGDAVIQVKSVSGGPVDFAVAVESASLQGTDAAGDSTLLASNIGIQGLLGGINMSVDTATDSLNAVVLFTVTDMDMDVDFLAVGIRDLTVRGANFNPADPYSLFAVANVTMSKAANVRAASGEALKIDVATFAADVAIGAIEIGGTSIGSVALNDLVISDTTMQIYGH